MTARMTVGDRVAWCKTYRRTARVRRLMARIWNAVTGPLGVRPLSSPSRPAGDRARQLEQRRLGELASRGVRVPEIVGSGKCVLLLGDMGPNLSGCLKDAADTDARDALLERAVAALAAVHQRDGYPGQAVARNIVVAEAGIGFIDFEEDPLEIMPLHEAQARDWLLFASSIARHYAGRTEVLARLFAQSMSRLRPEVTASVAHTARRLRFLEPLTRRLGSRARALGIAVAALRACAPR